MAVYADAPKEFFKHSYYAGELPFITFVGWFSLSIIFIINYDLNLKFLVN